MGPGKILILLLVLFLLFGVKRLPALVASIGRGARQVKGALEEVGRPDDEADAAVEAPRAPVRAEPRPPARAEPRSLVDRPEEKKGGEPKRLL